MEAWDDTVASPKLYGSNPFWANTLLNLSVALRNTQSLRICFEYVPPWPLGHSPWLEQDHLALL